MCMGPGGSGAILSAGENGGPGPPGGEEDGSWHQIAEEVRRLQDVRMHGKRVRHNTKAPLCTEYVSSCALCAIICYTSIIVIMNCVLQCVYLFQENYSYGSKKTFAFIL